MTDRSHLEEEGLSSAPGSKVAATVEDASARWPVLIFCDAPSAMDLTDCGGFFAPIEGDWPGIKRAQSISEVGRRREIGNGDITSNHFRS